MRAPGHGAEPGREAAVGRGALAGPDPRRPRGRLPAHRRLAALAAAATATGAALVLVLAARHVTRAHIEVTRDEARMAAALWEASGSDGAAAIRAFLGDRATILPASPPGPAPATETAPPPAGPTPRTTATAPAYAAGTLDPAAWITVAPRGRSRTWPGRATIIALLGVLAIAGWAARMGRSAPRERYPRGAASGAAAVLAAVAVAAHGWAGGALGDVAAYRAAQEARAGVAALAYQDFAPPTVALGAAAGCAALVAALILFLLPRSARPRAMRRILTGWAFIAPAAVLLLLFTFGPLFFSLWISLHEWHLIDPVHPFTGLDNYFALLLDVRWWSAIRNTAVFTLHVPLAMAVALGFALLTQGSRRAVRWARLVLFLPSITSVVAIAVVWKWLLNDGYGLVNRVLESAGLGSVAWLTSPDTALVTLMAISVWMVVGYQMVVFQAGLSAIPRDWYDAARVDGAGPVQRFRHVTLPGLRHTLFFVLVTSVIGSFQVFGLVYVMTEGGPLGATDVAVYHIYREAWEFLRFGNAAAMSWMLFVVVFAATWLHFRLLEGRTAHV